MTITRPPHPCMYQIQVNAGYTDYVTCFCDGCDCQCTPLNPAPGLDASATFLRCERDIMDILNVDECTGACGIGADVQACKDCLYGGIRQQQLRSITSADMRKTHCGFFVAAWEAKCQNLWDLFVGIYNEYGGTTGTSNQPLAVEGHWQNVSDWSQFVEPYCQKQVEPRILWYL